MFFGERRSYLANHSRATNSKVSRSSRSFASTASLACFFPHRDQSPWQATLWRHHAYGGHLSGKLPDMRQNSKVSACPQICRPFSIICCLSPSHAGINRRRQKAFAPCRWPWRSAQRHRKVSCWYPPKQSGSVRRKPEKSTSILLNSKKIYRVLVFRVPKWRCGIGTCESTNDFWGCPRGHLVFTGQKEKTEITFFFVISAFYGLFWTSCWCRRGEEALRTHSLANYIETLDKFFAAVPLWTPVWTP